MRQNIAGHARRYRKSMRHVVRVVDNGVPVWTCPAKITPTPRDARVVESAGQAVTLRTYDVELPYGTPAPAGTDWSVKVTASPDERFVGLTMNVLDQPLGEQAVVRLVCVLAQ